ncbi:MAG: hypothetical protein LH629_09130, partial [Ignavibacteria bacterium]|nr:hypothetical protein [Ignavibacteria bacterium]
MRKTNIVLIVMAVLLISFTYWTFLGFTIFKKVVHKEEFRKCINVLSSKYENIKYSDSQRKENPDITEYQNLYDVQNYRLKLSFDIPKKYLFGNLE